MRFRVKYEVKGHLSFLSHLEMMRLWQRALLRSQLPIAWTLGFNPRPKLSLGPAKGVGIEGLGEYIDIDFKTYLKGNKVLEELNSVLPGEVRVLKVRELPEGTKLLEAVINEAEYRAIFPLDEASALKEKATAFMAEEHHTYVRHSPKGDKEIDLRSYVQSMEVKDHILLFSVSLGNRGALRPEELLTALGYWDIIGDIRVQRLGLYIKEGTHRSQP